MKKIIGVILVIAIIAVVYVFATPNQNTDLGDNTNTNQITNENLNQNTNQESNFKEITSTDSLSTIIDNVYAAQTMEMPMLQTQVIDVTDKDMVSYVTGLENGDNLEYAVVSEPMMSSQAYSFVLVKVKDGVNPDQVAKTMCDNIDERKWICVTAEKIYATSSDNVVCLVMSNAETAKAIYDEFKELAGKIGQEYERTAEEPELPEDMY